MAKSNGLIVQRGFPLEVRAADETDEGWTLEGYAAVFDTPAEILWFDERIARGAFRKTLAENKNIVALWDHNTGDTLASTRGGTLELSEDDHGLHFRLTVDPEIRSQRDHYLQVKRGDVTGVSFGFRVIKDAWTYNEGEERDTRELQEVHLFEISPTAIPAYSATEVEARSLEDARKAGTTQSVAAETTVEPEAGTDDGPDHADEGETRDNANHSTDGNWRVHMAKRRLELETL